MKKHTRRLCILAVLFLFAALPVRAAVTGSCGDALSWQLDDAGVLTISGTGPMEDFSGDSPWYASDIIKEIVIEEGVTSVSDYAFQDCWLLTSVTLPQSMETVGCEAFARCISLWQVELGGVRTIGDYAFGECVSLSDITVPASAVDITPNAFEDCNYLEGIWVDAENPNYASDSRGVLFSKDMTRLLRAPGGLAGIYTVPDTVSALEDSAFYGCGDLTAVTLPALLPQISAYCFGDCTSLTRADLGIGLRKVAANAFSGCAALEDVYYGGYARTWQTLSIAGGNEPLKQAALHVALLEGDADGNKELNTDDAVFLLLHIMFGAEDYPVDPYFVPDINADRRADTDDAVYLLLHTMFGAADYPLYPVPAVII